VNVLEEFREKIIHQEFQEFSKINAEELGMRESTSTELLLIFTLAPLTKKLLREESITKVNRIVRSFPIKSDNQPDFKLIIDKWISRNAAS
jgi:hypothetical protein